MIALLAGWRGRPEGSHRRIPTPIAIPTRMPLSLSAPKSTRPDGGAGGDEVADLFGRCLLLVHGFRLGVVPGKFVSGGNSGMGPAIVSVGANESPPGGCEAFRRAMKSLHRCRTHGNHCRTIGNRCRTRDRSSRWMTVGLVMLKWSGRSSGPKHALPPTPLHTGSGRWGVDATGAFKGRCWGVGAFMGSRCRFQGLRSWR